MRKVIVVLLCLTGLGCFGQNMQVVFDWDARGNQIARVLPFELAHRGDTTVILDAQYGLENMQERFHFTFIVKHQGSTFYKTSEHTTLTFQGENGTGVVVSQEKFSYAPHELEFHFIFTAGDLGYEDNDISLQRMGAIEQVIIHQLPEMNLTFLIPEEKRTFLKDLQNSLRIGYRKGETSGGSAIRGAMGNEKSNRDSKTKSVRGERLKL